MFHKPNISQREKGKDSSISQTQQSARPPSSANRPPQSQSTFSGRISKYAAPEFASGSSRLLPPTQLRRDNAPTASSNTTHLRRDKTSAQSSATQLHRDGLSQYGVAPGTQLHRDISPMTASATQLQRDMSKSRPPPSIAPPSMRTIHKRPEDILMAERQMTYASLPPKERNLQDEWVHRHIFSANTPCPHGYKWERIAPQYDYYGRQLPGRTPDGYQCNGGKHVITDDLIAEGKGGVWVAFEGKPAEGALRDEERPEQGVREDIEWIRGTRTVDRGNTDARWGPYYPGDKREMWCYAGEGTPEHGMLWILVNEDLKIRDVEERYKKWRKEHGFEDNVSSKSRRGFGGSSFRNSFRRGG